MQKSIILLASQSNCANGFYVDYIAEATTTEHKMNLQIRGQIFTNYDSISNINFVTDKCFNIQSNKKLKVKVALSKIKLGNLVQQAKNINDTSIKLPINTTINNKTLELDFILSNYFFQKGIEFELLCCVEFKNGCKYIKRQKVIL
ncbi:MAG: hypothetical protein NTZ59_04755 [Bacteroidetes bacterium]|nr:hypothetical protein [Bacteroidota bacterium]